MKTTTHKSDNRGYANHGWLEARHSFSFANYYNPQKIHFGALRVLNDDIIQPGQGFGRHPHDNMEIITIPLTGTINHRDSMGHEQTISPSEVQVMSAGKGIFHSEFNASETEALNLLQLWIFPDELNIEPVYNQKYFDPESAKGKWQTLVDRRNPNALSIHQKAKISRVFLKTDDIITYEVMEAFQNSYLFIVNGAVEVNSNILNERDAIGISETPEFNLKALDDSYIINIEVPDYKLSYAYN